MTKKVYMQLKAEGQTWKHQPKPHRNRDWVRIFSVIAVAMLLALGLGVFASEAWGRINYDRVNFETIGKG